MGDFSVLSATPSLKKHYLFYHRKIDRKIQSHKTIFVENNANNGTNLVKFLAVHDNIDVI